MQNLPFVSIIVPVYNGEKIIGECIESLLNQTYPKDKYEIIIVDNNSKDRTAEIIKKYPVKYLLEDKIQSSYAARNKGVKHAKGEILAFTDADCIVSPQWLENGINEFLKDDRIGCVGGKSLSYQPSNQVEEFLLKKGGIGAINGPLTSYPIPFFPTLNVFYKKEVFKKIGLFDTTFYSGGDVDFCWRMQFFTDFKLAFAPEAIIYHKERANFKGLFKQRKWYAKGRVLLYKKHQDRLPKRTLKQIYWSYWNLFSPWMRFLKLRLEAFINKKTQDYWYEAYLEAIIALARKLGHWEGMVKYKVFYP